MPEIYDSNALWVAISEYGEGNLFSVWPKMLFEMLSKEDAARVGDTSEAEKLVLPSDWDWRLVQYFKLVEMQKTVDLNEVQQPAAIKKAPEEEWTTWSLELSLKNPHSVPPVTIKECTGQIWDIEKLLKAARLLCKDKRPVEFADEQEMRHVYSIIYDVFRYKNILNQAIDDVVYFSEFSMQSEHRPIIWLFLMELARRSWTGRVRGDVERATRLLEEAGPPFNEIERAVWDQRVHFAAAIARIRIKNRAYTLTELLPEHLRDERVSACVNKETITGWVNTFKAKKVASLVKRLHELGYSYSNSRMLSCGEYRFDRVCPRFITLHPLPHSSIGQLELVKDGVIVLQEREFCEGASTFCRALQANELRGAVAQTHASSPRCSAYLAAQLRDLASVLKAKTPAAPATPQLGKLIVFGAGDKVESYVESLRHLGVEASVATQQSDSDETEVIVSVHSDPIYCSSPTVINALEDVVAALATPPNSYSAVSDPIDLVCGRGGDLAMLEVLTETVMDKSGEARVHSILEEQKKTLKTLMSKPQIQLILYETHSALEAENQAQVTRAVAEANRLAREKYSLIKKKYIDSGLVPVKCKDPKVQDSLMSIENTISRSDISIKSENEDDFTGTMNSEFSEASSPKKIKPMSENQDFVLRKNPDFAEKRPGTSKTRPIPDTSKQLDLPRDPDRDNPDVSVPNCDLFEIVNLPILGNGLDLNFILDRDGCYLGLIRRKEVTRLDAKFMIRVAEDRGLFGAAPGPTRSKKPTAASAPHPAPHRRRRRGSFQVERVAAPTHSSMIRSYRRSTDLPPGVNDTGCEHFCEKHARRQAAAAVTAAACTCTARHKTQQYPRRHSALADTRPVTAPPAPPAPHSPVCREPFPITVQQLQLRTESILDITKLLNVR